VRASPPRLVPDVSLPQPVWGGLDAEGYSFSRPGAPSEGIIRIACAFEGG
jgi:hypothetical protein